jgi:hypothetical protein
MGIDLVWLGVLLCVNMQTSFMHPPFGFALFYLRGIAPKEVKSSDIYWGAIPWVFLQIVMVTMIIVWPEIVTAFMDQEEVIDTSKIEIVIPEDEEAPAQEGAAKGKEEEDAEGAAGDKEEKEDDAMAAIRQALEDEAKKRK